MICECAQKYLKMAIWKPQHRYLGITIGIGIGIGIGIAKILFLPYKIFFEKIGH